MTGHLVAHQNKEEKHDLSKTQMRKRPPTVIRPANTFVNPAPGLAEAGSGQKIFYIEAKQTLFSQGESADSVFFLHSGRAKLTVVSPEGKEATIAIFSKGDFIGEESIAGATALRQATATAISACQVQKIDRAEMLRVIHEDQRFVDLFVKFLVTRSIQVQADLVNHMFNNSEKRLARRLLLMAEFGAVGESDKLLPKISQKALAEMIGTSRSRVNIFMNQFRKDGFIDYKGRIRVHRSLASVLLND
jgi:CRP/FNR family transcriptional regulator, cyclic AMP receptor protein